MRIRLTLALAAATAVTGGAVAAFAGSGHTTTLAASPASSSAKTTSRAPAPGSVINGQVFTGPNTGGVLPGWSFTEAPLADGTYGKDGSPVCHHFQWHTASEGPTAPSNCHLDPAVPLLPPDPNNPTAP